MSDIFAVTTKPFLIAELSGNHNQSLDRALLLVEAAAKAGADAIKLQTFTPETMTLDINEGEFVIDNPENIWHGESIFELYKKAQTPWEWHREIFDLAESFGMLAFSSPFDETAVAFLEKLNVPFYKIASFENTDIPLIEKVSATGKPVIISTGMISQAELDETVSVVRDCGCKELVLLKCTSTYPASPENSNLLTIPDLKKRYQCHVGLSDHTLGIGVSVASVALGASVIEKHFTLNRSDGGVDSTFSMEPSEFKLLVSEAEKAWLALGDIHYGPTKAESFSSTRRRSIYITADLTKGQELSPENLRCLRPGSGLAPKYYKSLLGRKVNQDIKRGSPMSWVYID